MLVVRDARSDEYDAIADLTVDAYRELEVAFGPERWAMYEADLRDVRGRASEGEVLVAIDDDGLVGAAALLRTDDPGERFLRALAVAPEARRRGVARVLMDNVIRRAQEHGAKVLRWHTGDFFEGAVATYTALGYEPEEAELRPAGHHLLTYRIYFS